MFYYVAMVRDDVTEFAEHYEDEKIRNERASTLSLECALRGDNGVAWSVYAGTEPFECYRARAQNLPKEGEDKEEWEARLKVALDHWSACSTSKLTDPPFDDSWPFERCPKCRHRIGVQVWMPDQAAECPECGWAKPLAESE